MRMSQEKASSRLSLLLFHLSFSPSALILRQNFFLPPDSSFWRQPLPYIVCYFFSAYIMHFIWIHCHFPSVPIHPRSPSPCACVRTCVCMWKRALWRPHEPAARALRRSRLLLPSSTGIPATLLLSRDSIMAGGCLTCGTLRPHARYTFALNWFLTLMMMPGLIKDLMLSEDPDLFFF